jgi:hypothetical protein
MGWQGFQLPKYTTYTPFTCRTEDISMLTYAPFSNPKHEEISGVFEIGVTLEFGHIEAGRLESIHSHSLKLLT